LLLAVYSDPGDRAFLSAASGLVASTQRENAHAAEITSTHPRKKNQSYEETWVAYCRNLQAKKANNLASFHRIDINRRTRSHQQEVVRAEGLEPSWAV
jgi:hypothetical protein